MIQNTISTSHMEFNPVYRTRSDVNVSPLALAGMKQSGLCVMKGEGVEFLPTDSFAAVEGKLSDLFPRLFTHLLVSESDETPLSSWLVCIKPSFCKQLVVYSDDSALPCGFDIISACQMSKPKVGFQERTLYLGMIFLDINITYFNPFLTVTREPVPHSVVMQWRPTIPACMQDARSDSEIADDSSDNEASGSKFESALTSVYHQQSESEDEVVDEVINISGNYYFIHKLIILNNTLLF
jgi:hypothetical protein